VYDRFAVRIYLVHARQHFREANMFGVRNAPDRDFAVLADVDDLNVVAVVEALL
jgi:hypothetical protein